MAVQLLTELNSVKHEFYHDLESLFYVMCYICCICAGPNYTLRRDKNVFKTAIGKWLGKKNQTESQIGEEKYRTVLSSKAFKKSILVVFHPYFDHLKPFMKILRDIAIPPHDAAVSSYIDMNGLEEDEVEKLPFHLKPMEVRGEKQLEEYRDILQKLFNSLPEDDPPLDGSNQASHDPSQRISPQAPEAEPNQSPIMTRILQNMIGDDYLYRAMDLPPQEEDDPQDKQEDDGETQDEDTKESATLVGRVSGGSRSGKRKIAALEEGELEDGEDGSLQTPTPVSKSGRSLNNLVVGSSRPGSLAAWSGSSKSALEPITETPELEGPAEIGSGTCMWRSDSKDSKRRRTREELEG
jgi:hypothetical protein